LKAKLLIVTNHYYINSGYSTVTRNVYQILKDKFDIRFFCTADVRREAEPKIYQSTGDHEKSLKIAYENFKPDVVLTMGDLWRREFVFRLKADKGFPLIYYLAVEGEYFPEKIHDPSKNDILDFRKYLNSIDYLITYSEFGKRNIERIRPVDDVIPHGVDTSLFKPTGNKKDFLKNFLGIEEDKFIVLSVSDNQPRKRVDLLFRAFADWNKEDAILFFVGQAWKEGGHNLENLAQRYGILDKVYFASGYRQGVQGLSMKDLVEAYTAADVFCLTSCAEGFGLPYLESLACGTSVIYPDYATPAEFLKVGTPIKIKSKYPVPELDYFGVEIDTEDLRSQFEYYYNAENINKQNNIDFAKTYDWKEFKGAWVNAINKAKKKPGIIGGLV
jgi:glycosyltransferase involved in cell wall biosynthesis